MNQMGKKYPPNSFRVCIDDTVVDLRGRIYSPLCEGELQFAEFRELILQMDALFDQTGYPQSFQEKRSFKKVSAPNAAYRGVPATDVMYQDMQQYCGEIAALDVRVESRRNASWQGRVFSTEGQCLGEYDGEWGLIDIIQKYLQKMIPM